MGKIKNNSNYSNLDEIAESFKNLKEFLIQKNIKEKIWTTKEGTKIAYSKLTDIHLNAILILFEQGKFKDRIGQLHGLKEEKLRRSSKAGEILYGN